MKWEEMGVENIESVLEKIWDLHDKLSDAIHSTSRSHFLSSIRSHSSLTTINGDVTGFPKRKNNNKNGYVYFKDFSGGVDLDGAAVVQEAKSLNAIRSALENLEDQLEFFHTIQTQRQTERDAAISRIEQSRVILAMKLAEHQGKKYDVIKEARAFVGDVCETTRLVSPAASLNNENFVAKERNQRRNAVLNALKFGFNYVKRFFKVDCVGGVVGNAAMVAISMFALMHFHEVGLKNRYILEQTQKQEASMHNRNVTRVFQLEGSSSTSLNVLSARG